jgi:glutathione S-transferase
MPLRFYYGSGSPYAWRVWLALEHKAIPYELKPMSFSAGDLTKPEYAALNPRHKVPTIVDDDFVLYESAAIVEYLEERYLSGKTLFPGNVGQRAVIRRLVREADDYLTHSMERLLDQVLFTKQDQWDLTEIVAGRADFLKEVDLFERYLRGDWFGGSLSAADFTIYPMIALCLRTEKKKPDLGLTGSLPPKIAAWMKRIQALPYHDKTYPPHWKANP